MKGTLSGSQYDRITLRSCLTSRVRHLFFALPFKGGGGGGIAQIVAFIWEQTLLFYFLFSTRVNLFLKNPNDAEHSPVLLSSKWLPSKICLASRTSLAGNAFGEKKINLYIHLVCAFFKHNVIILDVTLKNFSIFSKQLRTPSYSP